jgi:hypothetical protein
MASNFDNVILERAQEDLLIALVESARKQPRDQRHPFAASRSSDGTVVIGLKSFSNPYFGDIEALVYADMLHVSRRDKYSMTFDVAPLGFLYYEHLIKSRGQAVERVEENIMRYLDTSGFEKRHPEAYAKWYQAQELIWSSDSQKQHTAIGHHCREAMQFFATSLVDTYKPETVDSDITKTRNRLKAVIEQAKPGMSDKIAIFLDSLASYWNALIDLSMRQEHGAQKEGEVLTWEDSRRLVFHTAIVMVEVDRALKDTHP